MAKPDQEQPVTNGKEPGGEPTSPTSTKSEPQVSRSQAKSEQRLSDEDRAWLKDQIERTVQSQKDVRFQRHENQLTDIEETVARLDELMSQGNSKEEALWKMKVERQLEGHQTEETKQERVSEPEPTGIGANLSELAATIAEQSGVDSSSNAFNTFVNGLDTTDTSEVVKATMLFVKEQLDKPQPSAADVSQPSTETPPPKKSKYSDWSKEELGDELARLAREEPRNREERRKIREELERRD